MSGIRICGNRFAVGDTGSPRFFSSCSQVFCAVTSVFTGIVKAHNLPPRRSSRQLPVIFVRDFFPLFHFFEIRHALLVCRDIRDLYHPRGIVGQVRQDPGEINCPGSAGRVVVIRSRIVVEMDVAGCARFRKLFKDIVEPGMPDVQHEAEIPGRELGDKVRLAEVETLPRAHVLDPDPHVVLLLDNAEIIE